MIESSWGSPMPSSSVRGPNPKLWWEELETQDESWFLVLTLPLTVG